MAVSTKRSKVYNVDFTAIRQTVDDDGTQHMELRGLSLRRGSYNFTIGYIADEDAQIEIVLENDTYVSDILNATGQTSGTREYGFEVKTGTDRGRIDFTYPEGSELSLAYITISSDRPMNYDGIIWGIFILVLMAVLWAGGYCFSKSTHKVSILVTFGIAIILIIPFVMNSGLNLGTDTRGQMMRIEGVYYGLLDGQFPVVIYPEWNNSYGQIGVLYPNLFLYIPAVLRVLGMSQLGACKLFIFLIIMVSSVTAYVSARCVFRQEWQIILTVMILSLDNMRLTNMLDDGRLGGALLAEMFYPLVIAGLIDLFYRDRKRWYLLSIGMAGIFCCHIMSATIICLATGIFMVCAIRRINNTDIFIATGKAIALFAALTAGIAVCFLSFFFSDWGQDNLQWEDFLSTLFPTASGSENSKWIFLIALLLISGILLIMTVYEKKAALLKNTYVIPAFICGMVLFWMSTSAFPWVYLRHIPAIEYYSDMIQNAYRFLTLACCFLAFVIPGLVEITGGIHEGEKPAFNKKIVPVLAVAGVLCIFNYITTYYTYFYRNTTVLYYDTVIGEIESRVDDYLPAGTDPSWYESDTGYISDEEAVQSISYERSGTHIDYSYTNTKDGTYAEFPKFYYDGYVAENEVKEPVEVNKGDRNRVRVYLKTTDSPAEIKIWYKPTPLMTLAFTFSCLVWVGSVLIVILRMHKIIDK